MKPLTLFFEETEGEAAKRHGMELVTLAESGSGWNERAEKWVLALPRGFQFTAETLTDAIGRPARTNSVGARMSAMAKQGWIRRVGFVLATRPSRHANVNRSWERV